MGRFTFLLDRTAVLFLGVAAGAAIGFAFGSGGERGEAVSLVTEAAPVEAAPAAIAPPPPTARAASRPAATPDEVPATSAAAPESAPPPPPADSIHAEGIVRVGVFGDSFGDGVWSALYRLLPAKAGYQVVKYSQPSTGFTRYRRLNLEQHDEERIAAAPIDVAVISFGANDAQGVCDGEHCGKLMSPFWQRVIAGRATSYVAMLRRHGATVYWLGLPVMRDPAFDGDAAAMNAFFRRLTGEIGVSFVDIRALTGDANGRYQAFYRDDAGTQKLFRANDGIHMSMNGYIHVTKGLAERIRTGVAAANEGSGE